MLATMQPEERASPRNREFGEIVTRLLGDLSPVDATGLTSVNHMTIQQMRKGATVPQYKTLVRFADGLGVKGRDRLELFRAAGYVEDAIVMELTAEYAARSRLMEIAEDFTRQTGKPALLDEAIFKMPRDTPADLKAIQEALRKKAS